MARYHPSTPLSARQQAKMDKEILNSKPKEQKQPDRSLPRIKNSCVFGKWNPNFNKYCL